jgi:hypothetical protein
MIALPPGAQVLLATRPVDFRKGAHALAALAAEVLDAGPFAGAVLVCMGFPLAPDIVEAIMDGLEPEKLTLPALMEAFPVEWERQREATSHGSDKS